MKAIILAAGKGLRLETITQNMIPKCMIPFNDRPILEWQISTFKECGISDIIVVVAHKAEQIRNLEDNSNVTTILNDRYDKTNMLESLFCAEGEISGQAPIFISYADIIFEKRILNYLNDKDNNDITLAVDTNWYEYWKKRGWKNPYKDAWETIKKENDKSYKIKKIGHTAQRKDDEDGHFIGLMMIKNKGIDAIKECYHQAQSLATDNYNPLSNTFTFENSRLVDLIQYMCDKDPYVYSFETVNGWLEFDTHNDHRTYEELLKNNELNDIVCLENVSKKVTQKSV